MARLGERNCYYYVIYRDDYLGVATDLVPLKVARDYAEMFDGDVHIHSSAPRWRHWLWRGR